jgi:hypothetical protein
MLKDNFQSISSTIIPIGKERSIGIIDIKELINPASLDEKPILFKNNGKRVCHIEFAK